MLMNTETKLDCFMNNIRTLCDFVKNNERLVRIYPTGDIKKDVE
jgi:hypothetical protein